MAPTTLQTVALLVPYLASGASAFNALPAPARRSHHVIIHQHRPHSALASAAVASSPASSTTSSTEKRTAPSVVANKFDNYAPTFEEHLVKNLMYCAPQKIARAASDRITSQRGGQMYASALDAGCGTGLAGPLLRELVSGPLVGVDLSPKMAELAAELVIDDGPDPIVENRMRRCAETARTALGSEAPGRLYEGMFTADLLHLDEAQSVDGYGHVVRTMPSAPFELIVSADVLCYFGAMDEVFRVFAERLATGGDLIFTTETMNAGDYNWVECSTGRYAHNPEYVARMATEAGLATVSQVAFTPRMESGEKVLGTLHTLTKPSAIDASGASRLEVPPL